MVYDWEGKEAICYRMYIEEKKSLEEIMGYMKVEHQFTPSKRAFQTQFKRWRFPSKQNPAHKNPQLVARIKELWEHNTCQRDMLRILNNDGFHIKERELMRVRAKNRWLLRVPNGMKARASMPSTPSPNDEAIQAIGNMVHAHDTLTVSMSSSQDGGFLPESEAELSSEVIQKRKERLEDLRVQSAERWASRKRRRRTRGWAGLPADPPGPPRFPSETTIDESKRLLSLDNETYKSIREQFQKLCEESRLFKKTVAGPERWQAVKDKLIQQSPHLQSVFLGDNSQLDAKALALDVVCTDVTKRMRTLERRMTIADAKNALGINPEESRQVRNAFYQILKSDHFTSKLEAGGEHWRELKDRWIGESPLLQKILAAGTADPKYSIKVKAVEILCRDVMKRLRDDHARQRPPKETNENSISSLASQALANTAGVTLDYADLQIDPSLLEAANNPSISIVQQPPNQFTTGSPYAFSPSLLGPPSPALIPVYFRLSPYCKEQPLPRVWLGTLTSISVNELRQIANSKYPSLHVSHIRGITHDAEGREITFDIDEDDELDAYLTHTQGGKATFAIEFMNGQM